MDGAGPTTSTFLTLRDCNELKHRLEEEALNVGIVVDTLEQLLCARTTLESLIESKLARYVKKQLTKHPDAIVSERSRSLVEKWSELATLNVIREATFDRPQESPGAESHPWLCLDDAVLCVLEHCGSSPPTLLALKAVSKSWQAKIEELSCAPAWVCPAC